MGRCSGSLRIGEYFWFCRYGYLNGKGINFEWFFMRSPGWQKLWITFAHSCLYFYKSANETTPLASLPLLGYKIELLSDEEKSQVQKENVFKLAFKAHVYYFRAESR